MTKDTEALREALTAHYPTGEWMQPCGNHVLCCSCGENLWGVDRDACKAAWRTHVIEALATPVSDELGFDPTAEVGDEVFPHDTIGSHFGNGGGFDPVAGGEALREATAKYADMEIDERAEAMADDCAGDPWELIGYFREKLRQSREQAQDARNAAISLTKKLAALQGPAA